VWRGRGAIVNNCDVHRGHRPLFESAEDESLRFRGTPVVDTGEQYIVSTFHSLGQFGMLAASYRPWKNRKNRKNRTLAYQPLSCNEQFWQSWAKPVVRDVTTLPRVLTRDLCCSHVEWMAVRDSGITKAAGG
jgi:hypothetical protein